MSYLCAGCENRLHSAKSSELAFALICTIFAYIVKAGRARRNKWNSVLLPLLAWTLQFYGTMKTIREIYRIGYGPSSSHTMGPRKASEIFLNRHPEAVAFEVILYGSLAATGKGHLTDVAILDTLQPHAPVEIVWKPSVFLSFHPNGMTFRSKNSSGEVTDEWTVFSVGGGALAEEGKPFDKTPELYEMNSILKFSLGVNGRAVVIGNMCRNAKTTIFGTICPRCGRLCARLSNEGSIRRVYCPVR